jgi:hypothetical protein
MTDIGGMPMKISKSVKSAIENASLWHESSMQSYLFLFYQRLLV